MFESNLAFGPSIETKISKLVVMLHGIGSDGHDMLSLVPYMKSSLLNYDFYAPNGVEPYDMENFGYQWFSRKDMRPKAIMESLERNIPKIKKLISSKQQELNLGNRDTILLGFSQGAMISTYLALVEEFEPFHSVISFSGKLLPPPQVQNTKTPFCITHGMEDEILLPEESKLLANYLGQYNIKYDLYMFNQLAHSIDARCIEKMIKFLREKNGKKI